MTDVATPVDVRVPFHSLQSVKRHLESLELEYLVMIQDLQVQKLQTELRILGFRGFRILMEIRGPKL